MAVLKITARVRVSQDDIFHVETQNSHTTQDLGTATPQRQSRVFVHDAKHLLPHLDLLTVAVCQLEDSGWRSDWLDKVINAHAALAHSIRGTEVGSQEGGAQ